MASSAQPTSLPRRAPRRTIAPLFGAVALLLVAILLAALALTALARPASAGTDVGPAAGAGWQSPLPGRPHVLRPFVAPASAFGPGHRGVDLAAAPGAVVSAAGTGRVAFAGAVAGRGVLVLQHGGGLRTTYEPVAPLARAGAVVPAGAPVGTLAGPGHCGPRACLHWGLRRGEEYVDPMTLLAGGRLMLLPHLAGTGRAGRPDPPAQVGGTRAAAVATPAASERTGAAHAAAGGAGAALAAAGLAAAGRVRRASPAARASPWCGSATPGSPRPRAPCRSRPR